jgi:hypothetical protein
MKEKEVKKEVKKERMSFGKFAQQPHIKGLVKSEKRRLYNIYTR